MKTRVFSNDPEDLCDNVPFLRGREISFLPTLCPHTNTGCWRGRNALYLRVLGGSAGKTSLETSCRSCIVQVPVVSMCLLRLWGEEKGGRGQTGDPEIFTNYSL